MDSQTFDIVSLCEEFLQFLQVHKASSENTKQSYWLDLKQFFEFFDADKIRVVDLKTIDESVILDFIQYLSEAKISLRSVQRKISTLRAFFEFLQSKNYVKSSPLERIKIPKAEAALPEVFSEAEMEALLKAADTREALGARDSAMLEVMYSCGLRVSELLDLELRSIQWDDQSLLVKGKRDKERWVPMGRAAVQSLRNYIDEARPKLMKGRYHDSIFVNQRGLRLTRQGFWKILKGYAVKLKLRKDLHPHILRHSFASHMLARGADLRSIQELLGHTDIATTQVYTRIQLNQLREDYERYHPRAG